MVERRNQGFLTQKDRATFEESSSEQYPAHFRERTREKFRQALADLAFTARNFEEEDVAEVFRVLADHDLIETTTYTHESFTHDTIAEALSLFFQGIDIADVGSENNLESLIEKAIKKAYQRTHPDRVVGAVDFSFETALRQAAYDRGVNTGPDELPTKSERQAMFDASLREIYNQGYEDDVEIPENEIILQGSDLTQYISKNLDKIEPGLVLSELQPDQSHDQFQQPDIFCEDQTGRLVLIMTTHESLTEEMILEAKSFLDEYGGPEQARSMILSPDMSLLQETSKTIEPGIEFHELRVGPYGVIVQIDKKTP